MDGLNVESILGDDVFRGQSLTDEVDSEADNSVDVTRHTQTPRDDDKMRL